MNRRSFFTKLAVGAAAAPQLAKVAAEAPKPTILAPFSGCTGTWDFACTESMYLTEDSPIPFGGAVPPADADWARSAWRKDPSRK